MADSQSRAARRYTCEALPPGIYPDIVEMIEATVDVTHGGSYAGYRAGDYIATLRHHGGIVFSRDTGEPAAFAPFATRRGRGTRLQFPIIEPGDENRGLQCLAQSMQLLSALLSASMARPPVDLYIPFPDDRMPSPRLVHLLGLCDAMPERPSSRGRAVTPAKVHRFDIRRGMLPRVIAAMLERSDPRGGTSSLIGTAYINTIGTAGRARIHLPQESTPLSAAWLPTLIAIASGKLSVIGLEDVPVSKFGA